MVRMKDSTMTAKLHRIVIVSHGHPQLAPGGGEIVAHELYRSLKKLACLSG